MALTDIDSWESGSCSSHFLDISSPLPCILVIFFSSGTFQRAILNFLKQKPVFGNGKVGYCLGMLLSVNFFVQSDLQGMCIAETARIFVN